MLDLGNQKKLTDKMWKVYLVPLMSVAIVFAEANTGCTSTEKGDCCVFPFKYNSDSYNSCSFIGSSNGKPWCSLTSDYDKDKKYGYCSLKTCEVQTTDGDCCVFPFTYGSVTYYACTKTLDSVAWCGTKSDVEFWSRQPRGNCEPYVNPCFYNPCENNGTCQSNKNQFTCKCTEGWKGKTCSQRVNPCKISPCQNGGECFSELETSDFYCKCPQEYKGTVCEKRVYPCDSSPCDNNGTCENIENSFKCTCTEQYQGDHCETTVDPCENNPCLNGGKCLSDLSKFTTSCSCPEGYEGDTCQDRVYPCDSSPCENNGTCEDSEDTFKCTCTEQYEGETCELKVDVCKSGPCENEGKCFSDLSKEEFHCSCAKGYEGQTCSERVNPCASSPCFNNATCEVTHVTQFVCKCPKGYKGEFCQEEVDPCENSPCKNEGKCESEDGKFSCECKKGFTGKTCEIEVDPCGSSPCENGGACKPKGRDYVCDCRKATNDMSVTGFQGPNCANKGFWTTTSKLTPPYHIVGDLYGNLGARFVDLNGDGRMDFVYNCWIKTKNEKGAYLNLPGKGFCSAPQFTPPYHIAAANHGDLGARFVDLNGDDKADMVYHRIYKQTTQKGAYLNTGNGWRWAPQYTPPFHIATFDGKEDLGARFVELNGDGKIDFVYHRWLSGKKQQKGAYLNTGNGWASAPDFIPPFHIAAPGHGDLGARFTDLNGDGKADLIYNRWINLFSQQKGAYLNNGKKWVWARQYIPPHQTAVDGIADTGLRLVDFNGDGKIDIVYYRWLNALEQQKGAYLNNGNGWTNMPSYTPPFHIAADKYGDLGARFADVNGDGLIDFVYHRWISSKRQQKGAYINSGCGWRSEPRYIPLFHIAADGFKDLGARFVELNGDGATDFAYNRLVFNKSTQKGAYLACGDTNPAFCLIYSKYCSLWKVAHNMCRRTCNTCQL